MRREEGFTLLEILISGTISAIVMGALIMFVTTGYRTFQGTATVMSETTELSLVRLLLTEDMRAAYPDAALTFTSDGGKKLTLGVYDQRFGFRSIEYQYVTNGTIRRTVFAKATLATAAPTVTDPGGQTIARLLAPAYPSAIFSVDLGQKRITATIPLPGRTPEEPTRTFDISALMRSQT